MSYNFKNLADVELLEGVPEYANAFVEVDGMIKRVPGKGLSSEGGIKTAIIKQSDYDEAVEFFSGNGAGPASAMTGDAPAKSFECINMTFDEAYQTIMSGEPLAIMGMIVDMGLLNAYGIAMSVGTLETGEPLIMIMFILASDYSMGLYWTADGISTKMPGGGSEPV